MATTIDPAVEKSTHEFRGKFQRLRDEIGKAIVGHAEIVDGVLTCLFVGGHALLEGVPGLGKTYLVSTLAKALSPPWIIVNQPSVERRTASHMPQARDLRIIVTSAAFVAAFAAYVPDFALGADPVIHVAWGEPGMPVPDIHYRVTTSPPGSADFPDVELIAGSLTWRVWSTDPDNPAGVGDIGVISSPHPQNFGVRIDDAIGNPGARHVKGIVLDPTSGANLSRITGGRISGNLDGTSSLRPTLMERAER